MDPVDFTKDQRKPLLAARVVRIKWNQALPSKHGQSLDPNCWPTPGMELILFQVLTGLADRFTVLHPM